MSQLRSRSTRVHSGQRATPLLMSLDLPGWVDRESRAHDEGDMATLRRFLPPVTRPRRDRRASRLIRSRRLRFWGQGQMAAHFWPTMAYSGRTRARRRMIHCGHGKRGDGMYDAAIIGGGIAGMATALRLQARGLATVVLEAHGQPGGCAGFFRRQGFRLRRGSHHARRLRPRRRRWRVARKRRDDADRGRGAARLRRLAARPHGDAAPRPGRLVPRAAEGPRRHAGAPIALATPGPAGGRLLAGQPGRGQAAHPGRRRCDPRGASGRPRRAAAGPLPALGRWPTRCGHTAWGTIGRWSACWRCSSRTRSIAPWPRHR